MCMQGDICANVFAYYNMKGQMSRLRLRDLHVKTRLCLRDSHVKTRLCLRDSHVKTGYVFETCVSKIVGGK